MGDTIEITAADDHHLGAYVAGPQSRAGLVVVQEIFGVNGHIRSVVDGFADVGYRTIAPALFDRAEPGVELDYTQPSIERGLQLARGGAIPQEHVLTDLVAAADVLRGEGVEKVGVVGYCWGGYLATLVSIERAGVFDAAVAYYGGGTPGLADSGGRPQIPLLMHFGETDHAIALDDVRRIESTWDDVPTGVTVHVYEGAGHGFNCDQRASYDAQAAELALERTLAFFAEHLR